MGNTNLGPRVGTMPQNQNPASTALNKIGSCTFSPVLLRKFPTPLEDSKLCES